MTNKKKLVALTGNGISVESGLPTLSKGMWEQKDVKELMSIDGWNKNPQLVQRFYNERRKQLGEVEPNNAHRILVELEKDFDVTIITQCVDDLHKRAGSSKIIHLHGELTKARSSAFPNMIFDIGYCPIEQGEQAPDGSPLRPHIVWFGEEVTMIEAAQSIVSAADIFVIVGSALEVYPAAELVKYAKAKTPVYLINPSEVKYSGRIVTVIQEKATVGMEKLKTILSEIPNESNHIPNKENWGEIPSTEGKTNIYNVVILDQSGSMGSIRDEAINGFNETLQTIKAAQREHAEVQEHYVTLVVFNSTTTDTVYNNTVCTQAAELNRETYVPDCGTPLYDAMGNTLSKFRNSLENKGINPLDKTVDNKVLVTVITDGQENDSKKYTGKQIHQMVTELKALGWVFTYIGANHDVEEAALRIGVTNSLKFESTKRGTKAMFARELKSRKRYYDKVASNDIVEMNIMEQGNYFKDYDDSDKA